jgi:methionyl-tRNA formyltransferase
MRVLFWGTPAFATPPLRALLGEGFDVVGVVTQPDRPVGRSRSSLQPSPVKEIALAENVPVLQPEKPRGSEFVAQLRDLKPDISVVVAYGHILPADVIALPPRGTLNIHASLLPKLRGAAPIEAAILEGHAQTGVSIMRMVQRLDAGPVILQLSTPIPDDETGGELTLRLSELGATALIEALALLEMGKAGERAQDDGAATYAGKIERESARVDWSRDAASVARAIRAYDPRPGAFTSLDDKDVKLFGARAETRETPSAPPGEVVIATEDGIVVTCGKGTVLVTQVQPSGQKRMAVGEWLRGRGIAPGRRFK